MVYHNPSSKFDRLSIRTVSPSTMALELAKTAEVRRSAYAATRLHPSLTTPLLSPEQDLRLFRARGRARAPRPAAQPHAGRRGDVLKAPKPQEVTHNVLDLAVQKVVEKLSWKLMTEAHATPTSVGVPALLDLCIAGVTSNFLINSTPYKVLEDLMEGQTISTCEMVWELLESRKDKLTTVGNLVDLLLLPRLRG